MTGLQKVFMHPAYTSAVHGNPMPVVRIAILVACDRLGVQPNTSQFRERWLGFLSRSPVSELLHRTTTVDGRAWTSYASNGRLHSEAIWAGIDDGRPASPAAYALINLQEDGVAFSSDPRCAELIVHIERHDPKGGPLPPDDFATWYEALMLALDVPAAFVRFLSRELSVATHGAPPIKLGIEFAAAGGLRELFATADIPTIPGSPEPRSFLTYVIAEPDGQPASAAAVDVLRCLSDHALHLHGYEDCLEKLRNRNVMNGDPPSARRGLWYPRPKH
jgi:hypothetical protein